MTKNIKNNQDYQCFYDSEFNAYDDKSNLSIPQEVISIGITIVDNRNNHIEDYYSLIRLKAAKVVSNRCYDLTGIKTKDLKKAKDFTQVIKEINEIIKKYKIKCIYCYGQEDKKAIIRTAKLYNNVKSREVSRRLVDIREVFKKKTKSKIGDQGLLFIKKVCGLGDDVKHNALSDAIDLANCYNVIMREGYNEKLYNKLMKEREDSQHYKRARNIKDENKMRVPKDVYKAKELIVKYLKNNKIHNLNDGTKNAIIDDLNILINASK